MGDRRGMGGRKRGWEDERREKRTEGWEKGDLLMGYFAMLSNRKDFET